MERERWKEIQVSSEGQQGSDEGENQSYQGEEQRSSTCQVYSFAGGRCCAWITVHPGNVPQQSAFHATDLPHATNDCRKILVLSTKYVLLASFDETVAQSVCCMQGEKEMYQSTHCG